MHSHPLAVQLVPSPPQTPQASTYSQSGSGTHRSYLTPPAEIGVGQSSGTMQNDWPAC